MRDDLGFESIQEIDLNDVFKGCSVFCEMIVTPEQARRKTVAACQAALTTVYMSLTGDRSHCRNAGELATQSDGPARLQQVELLHALLEQTVAPDLAVWLTDLHLGETDSLPNDNAVYLLTVHGSKGLEFPIVILSGLGGGVRANDGVQLLANHAEGTLEARCTARVGPAFATRCFDGEREKKLEQA